MEEAEVTILIVDDEEAIRSILTRKLEADGYRCEVASDGNEALWKAFMKDFDLVLMDIKPGFPISTPDEAIFTPHRAWCRQYMTLCAWLSSHPRAEPMLQPAAYTLTCPTPLPSSKIQSKAPQFRKPYKHTHTQVLQIQIF
jgi:hypothetical protein